LPTLFANLALPIALAGLTEQLLGVVDTAVLGRISTGALASIATAGACYIVAVVAVTGLCIAVRIVGAQYVGRADLKGFAEVVRSCAISPLAAAACISLLSPFVAEPLLRTLLPSPSLLPGAAHYFVIRTSGLIFVAATSTLTSAFAASGDTRLALRILCIINGIHIPLVMLLTFGVSSWHGFGIVGTGMSSTLSEAIGCVYALAVAWRRTDLGLLSSYNVNWTTVKTAMRLSWPESVNLIVSLVPEPCTIAMLGSVLYIAAYRILAIVNDTCNVVPFAIADASLILMLQAIGAGASDRVRLTFRYGILFSTVLASGLAVGIAAISHNLATVLSGSVIVAQVVALPLALHIALTLPTKGYAVAVEARLYAAGDTTFIMAIGIIAGLGTLAVIFALTRAHVGLIAIPIAWTVSWLFRAIGSSIRVRAISRTTPLARVWRESKFL
jgi:Na+-driven multidrug efflux pump